MQKEDKKEDKKIEKSENNIKEYIVQCKNEMNEINNISEVKRTVQLKPKNNESRPIPNDCLGKN